MAETIDKLIFALGGDAADLRKAYAQAEAGAQQTGKTIQEHLGGAFEASAKKAASHVDQIKKSLGGAAHGAEELDTKASIAAREIRALFDEFSSGRYRQAMGSMTILLTRVVGISVAAIGTAAAVVGSFVAIGYAAEQAASKVSKLNTAIALTGNVSGVSASTGLGMAQQIAGGGAMGRGAAETFVAAMVGGMMPAGAISRAGIAAGNYELATGAKSEDVQKMILQMFQDPSKSAQELNTQMRLLTTEQTQEVQQLVRRGQQEEAGQIILQAFNDRAKDAADQVEGLGKAAHEVGVALGNAWSWLGRTVTGPRTDLERLQALQDYRAQQAADTGSNSLGVKAADRQIAELSAKIVQDFQQQYAAAQHKLHDQQIGEGLKVAQQEAGKFTQHLSEMKDALDAANQSVRAAQLEHSQYTSALQGQANAAKTAYEATQKYGGPEKEAQRRLSNARELARTPLEDQGYVMARQQAYESYYRNLQNPETANQAQGILRTDLAAAQFNRADVRRAQQQQKNLETMWAQADASKRVADAYGLSTGAGAKATAQEEAHLAVVEKSIAAADEHSAALAKEEKAFNDLAKAAAEATASLRVSNAGLLAEAGAGGNPAGIASARRRAEAYQRFKPMFDAAVTPEDRARAQAQYQGYLGQLDIRDRAQGIIQGNASIFGSRQTLANTAGQFAAFGAGATDDDMRRLKVMQQTFDDLVRTGLEPGSIEFKKLYDTLTPLNVQISDLADNFQKLQQEAKSMADAITGPLSGFVHNPTSNWRDMFANMGQGLAGNFFDAQITKPLNDWLTGQFGGLLGMPGGSLGSSVANPMWVRSADLSGIPGLGGSSGSGGLLGSLSGLGGNTGIFGKAGWLAGLLGTAPAAAADPFAAVISSMMADPVLMDSGGTVGPGQYAVKSGKPEIIQGGTAGVSVLPLDAPVVTAAIGSMASAGKRGAYTINRGGDTFNFHLPGVSDAQTFIRSRSQIEAMAATAARRGQRNL